MFCSRFFQHLVNGVIGATFLMTFLLKIIFKLSGKTNGARASETVFSGKENQL
jgi:hypothetical protein